MSTPTRPGSPPAAPAQPNRPGQHAAPASPPAAQAPAKPPASDKPGTGSDAKGTANGDAAKGRPGRKPGQPAKEYDFTGMGTDFLSNPLAVSDEIASITAPQRARDERQVAMDGVVAKKFREWKDAGSPTKWAQMPKARYHLNPAQVEGFRFLVRRAAEFSGVTIKWGTPKADKDGRQVIVFAVRSRRERTAAPGSTAPAGTPADGDDDTAGEE